MLHRLVGTIKNSRHSFLVGAPWVTGAEGDGNGASSILEKVSGVA